MQVLRAALDARDRQTGTRSKATVSLAVTVARRLGLDPEETSAVEQVAFMHDIGKICIPDRILEKRGPLDAGEWRMMHRHPAIGAQIVASVSSLAPLAPAIRAEHEYWNGTGYPDGLAGDQIPLSSRIVQACAALHAMLSDRPYRKAMPMPVALQAMRFQAGTHFDPAVIGALVDAVVTKDAMSTPGSEDAQPSVLVVDDDGAFRLALKQGLASEGFRVRVAATATQAYQQVAARCFDVILVDWLFPHGDSGATFFRHLRYLHPSGRIVVLTGLSDVRDHRAAREAGATAVLQKGIRLEELAEQLRSIAQAT